MTRATHAKVLFVANGSGHVKMVVPLAQVTRLDPDSDIRVRIIG